MKIEFSESHIVKNEPFDIDSFKSELLDIENIKSEFLGVPEEKIKNKSLGIKFHDVLRRIARAEIGLDLRQVPSNYSQNIRKLLVYPSKQRRSQAQSFVNLPCFICQKISQTVLDYKMHLAADHNLHHFHQYVAYHGFPWCERCGRFFDDHQEFENHKKTDARCDPSRCNGCNSSNANNELQQCEFHVHTLSCENRRNFKCEHCPLTFNRRSTLKHHWKRNRCPGTRKDHKKIKREQRMKIADRFRIHERKFQCQKCDNAYTTNQKLRQHFNIAHGKQIKFKCENCPKMLNSYDNMRSHMKICNEIHL